jgi:hypothetical protein
MGAGVGELADPAYPRLSLLARKIAHDFCLRYTVRGRRLPCPLLLLALPQRHGLPDALSLPYRFIGGRYSAISPES